MSSTPLQLRRSRVRLIRRRAVAGATAIFMASTGWIFAELVTGHDPALARQTTHSTTTTTTTASVASTSPASSSSSNSSGSSSSSASPTAVTTSAS